VDRVLARAAKSRTVDPAGGSTGLVVVLQCTCDREGSYSLQGLWLPFAGTPLRRVPRFGAVTDGHLKDLASCADRGRSRSWGGAKSLLTAFALDARAGRDLPGMGFAREQHRAWHQGSQQVCRPPLRFQFQK